MEPINIELRDPEGSAGATGPQRNDPYTLPAAFAEFCFMPKFTENIETLAQLAAPETWDYQSTVNPHPKPVLRNYLTYTYRRIAEEKKVAVTADERYACWNTGLTTESQEQIFIVFSVNKLESMSQYWHFSKFLREGEGELSRFTRLPDMAHYFDDPSLLVYDTRRELRVNVEHIVRDNFERFPESVKPMGVFGLVNLLKGAIESAKSRVRRNYKTAVPQYYDGAIQLLLPLCLLNPANADLALVIDRLSDFYRAATCLTLDMAYNNARQLAKPDRDWLIP